MSEMDKFGKEFYEKACIAARVSSPIKKKIDTKEHSGYLGSSDASREYLERMYKNSLDVPE